MLMEILLSSILFLGILVIYLLFRLRGTIKILKTIKNIEKSKELPKKVKSVEKKVINVLNETAEKLQCNVEEVPSKTNDLLKIIEDYKSESEKINSKLKSINKKLVGVLTDKIKNNSYVLNGCECFFDYFENIEEEVIKKICINFTKNDNSVVFLLSYDESMFIIVASSDNIADKGFDAKKIAKKIANKFNVKYGGKKSFAMLKNDKIDSNVDIFSFAKGIIEKEIKELF